MELQLSTRPVGSVTIVSVVGDIDLASAPRLAHALDAQVEAGRLRLVVDLERVVFMDSMGLGLLVGTQRLLRSRGGSMRLVCTVPRVLRIVSITDADKVLPIDADLATALAALAEPDLSEAPTG